MRKQFISDEEIVTECILCQSNEKLRTVESTSTTVELKLEKVSVKEEG